MAITANQSLYQPQHLDFKLVLRGTMVLAGLLLALAVFNPEPVAFAAGAIVPALCLRKFGAPRIVDWLSRSGTSAKAKPRPGGARRL
jgi:hypothetical protein